MTAGAIQAPPRDPNRPELVFGLIGALGADLPEAESQLRTQLSTVGYTVMPTIKLTQLLSELSGPPFDQLVQNGVRAHVGKYMDAGNELRRKTERGDALALLGVNAIRAMREKCGFTETESADRHVFIIDSIKHPQEVRALRRLYGPAFVAVAVYTQRSMRIAATQERLRKFYGSGTLDVRLKEAEELVKRDEDEEFESFGQHVSETFSLADVIIGDTGTSSIKQGVSRFVELFFGNWTWTPSVDETGMYFAQGARYRSASMARQVGAAILRADGTVVSTGTNDVPKAGGGLYGEADRPDGRDHARVQHQDASDFYKREVVLDFMRQLIRLQIIDELEDGALIAKVDEMLDGRVLKHSMLMSTIDYVRAVHAEMSALMDAARHGVTVMGCKLYTTTFPCHDCTKHIVASGVAQVVFLEPYAKSLTSHLFADSVAIDNPSACGYVHFTPFVGVLPRRYSDLFAMRQNRKDAKGMWIKWKAEDAVPALGDYAPLASARVLIENLVVSVFNALLKEKGIVPMEAA